ncbi:hypothetical protein KSP40_PGU000865 [Platanthera guangdongensis]|uniref:Uncharacterized protein n=1 Tax=Platanthera guangdongensis TaxID=2320717 RepID=A0ABR2LFL7_9ASPA
MLRVFLPMQQLGSRGFIKLFATTAGRLLNPLASFLDHKTSTSTPQQHLFDDSVLSVGIVKNLQEGSALRCFLFPQINTLNLHVDEDEDHNSYLVVDDVNINT